MPLPLPREFSTEDLTPKEAGKPSNESELRFSRESTPAQIDDVLKQPRLAELSIEAIKNEVIEIVCKTLGVDVEEVELHAQLIDLGAESLDVLDIVFRMEKHFCISVRGKLMPDEAYKQFVLYIESARTERDTASSELQALKKLLPHAESELDQLHAESKPGQLTTDFGLSYYSLFTVRMLTEYVRLRRDELRQKAETKV